MAMIRHISLETLNEIAPLNYSLVENVGVQTQDLLLEIRHNRQKYPRLRDMVYADAFAQMHVIISKALIYRGQEVIKKQVDIITSALLSELLDDFDKLDTSYLTTQEIAYAVRKAVLGDGELYGVTVASLYKAIVKYIKGEGRELQQQRPRTKDESASAAMTMLEAMAAQAAQEAKI